MSVDKTNDCCSKFPKKTRGKDPLARLLRTLLVPQTGIQ